MCVPAGRRASRTCRAWRSRRRFWSRKHGNNHKDSQWPRWHTCSLCEQDYHGVVKCALGWACWKTYVGRPETKWARSLAMSVLGNGLAAEHHHEDALSVEWPSWL